MLLIAGEPVANVLTRRSKAVDVDTKVKAQTASLQDQKIKSEVAQAKGGADLDVCRIILPCRHAAPPNSSFPLTQESNHE